MYNPRISHILFALSTAAVIISRVFAADFQSKQEWHDYLIKNPLPARGPTDDPPPQPVIPVAEWEPSTGVLVTYPLNIPIGLVAEMADIVEIWSVVNSESNMQDAIQEYLRAGIDTSNCHFLITGFWSTPWTRDFGPWYIFNGDEELGIINNIYYGGIPCTQVPQMLGDTLGIPVYDTGLHAEGGNYMTDGMGTAITTTYTYWGNEPLTPEQIDGIFAEYLGIGNLVTVQHPWGTMVPHIDCHAKLLDPGRIIVIEPDIVNPVIEQNVEYWSTLMSGYGRPYEILRVPGLGYANSLFLNDHVFIALSGNPVGDSTAAATFQEALPGYEVMGFTYPEFAFLDALHCRTHEMADPGMLRIVHVPVHDLENTGGDYYLEADIHPYSNEPLIGTPFIVWNVDGGAWNYTPMYSLGGDDWAGDIPAQPDGSEITYYLEAEDGSGRVENHPYIGSGNPHRFDAGPDTEPPVLEVEELPAQMLAMEWPLSMTVYALDNRWISEVVVEWSLNGVPQPDVVLPLEEPYAVYYTGAMMGTVQPGDVVEMRVRAVDTSINLNTSYWPETGYHTISFSDPPEVSVVFPGPGIPIYIPAGGGSFDFNIQIINGTLNPETFDIWTMITLPDSSEYGPVLNVDDFTLSAATSIDRDRNQSVPAGAPAGMYSYDGYIGDYPDVIWSEDHFDFEKLEFDEGGKIVSNWDNWGEEFEDTIAFANKVVPSKFVLLAPYPNPFNPTTTIRFNLPEAGKVSLVIYDVTGREVASLVNGHLSPGEHQAVWNAEGFSSGIYFARSDNGKMRMTQKLLLIK